MEADAVFELLGPVKDRLSAMGVERLLLVGSVARGEAGPGSDVDFVVEFSGKATFLGYMKLIELLEATLGVRVDLTTLQALHPEIAPSVLAGARQVA